jgi:REP element-mobilizing transposase RayT
LIEGGLYHVYNRVSHGEHVFRDESEIERFLWRLAAAKRRDGFQIFAWCVMSNHYHLAVRMGEVALSRSMWTLQQRFAQSYNGRHGVLGPFWQSRYRSKLVEDGRYLQQLVVYIHHNPVAAGLVNDARDYRWSGHNEVLGALPERGLVDVDETLAVFESTRHSAIASYRSSMEALTSQDWMGGAPGQLPWWHVSRTAADKTDELLLDTQRPLIGVDGLSTGAPRPRVSLADLVAVGASYLGVALDDVCSSRRCPQLMDARMALAWVAVELYRFRVKDVAAALGKYEKTASRWVRFAARRRVDDREFANLVTRADAAVIDRSRSVTLTSGGFANQNGSRAP